MTMHMLPSYYTTTNTKKRKKKNKSKSLIAAEKEHEKFLRRMGVGKSQKTSRSLAQSGSASALGAEGRRFESCNSDQSFYDPSMAKREPQVYNGKRKLLGIATMHKSNMVPVFSKDDAEDIAKMRRG